MTTRTPHDNFAKNYLKELLSPLGTVEIAREVSDEPNEIDILFVPYSSPSDPPASIGFLSRLAEQTCGIEVFRNQPDFFEVRNCLKKLYIYFSELNREAGKTRLKESDLGKLWIISTTASENLLNDFGATLDSEVNCHGVYSMHKALKASIIAVNQLPVTDDTLWLRILGKGGVQKQAVSEFLALPDTHPYRNNTLRMLTNLRIVILNQTDSSEEDREDVMELSTAYLEWEQKTEERGEIKGEQNMIIQQINYRFSEIDSSLIQQVRTLTSEKLTELGRAIFKFSTVTDLQQWLESRLQPVERQ
jgi:hypothetical protein